jgi:flagellar basal-body rod protein FlgB
MIQNLEHFLDLASARHTLIAGNMANVDTPGYRTRDLDFRGELKRAMTDGEQQLTPVVHTVPGLLQRPDGNDVSLDREGLLLSETQMQYSLGVQLIRSQFQQLMSAIHEGSK